MCIPSTLPVKTNATIISRFIGGLATLAIAYGCHAAPGQPTSISDTQNSQTQNSSQGASQTELSREPMNRLLNVMLLLGLIGPIVAHGGTLIVVEDRGGVSALPYYQDLAPEPDTHATQPEDIGVRGVGSFPVRSDQLTPGQIQGRVINAPGLQPLFLVGDDESSRVWLSQRLEQLQHLNAVGLVVNVVNAERFAEVQRWGSGLQMVPAPSNDLAQRLGIKHYPLLITATAIQQ